MKKLVMVHQSAPKQDANAQNAATDEPRFMPPKNYFEKDAPARRESNVQNADEDFEGGAAYALPQHYAATNEMLDPEELRQQVLRAMAKVDRSPAGSAERLAAERALITVRSNARTSCRARASELEAQLAALKRPGADQTRRAELERELASVTDLLETLDRTEDAPASKATNASGDAERWAKSLRLARELVRSTNE